VIIKLWAIIRVSVAINKPDKYILDLNDRAITTIRLNITPHRRLTTNYIISLIKILYYICVDYQ
jgi:hypothetical protein